MRNRGLLIAGTLLLGVALLGWAIGRGLTQGFDLQAAAVLSLRRGQAPDWLIAVTQGISWLGGGPQRTLIVVLIALALWRWRSAVAGASMALSSLTSNWTSNLLKLDFARPRPQLVPHLDDVGASLSYPSGHATSAAVVYLLLALVLPPRHRILWLGLAAVLTVLTGLSRVMLGVHYASDVAGGWMLGVAFALLGVELARRREAARP
jgi:undecaprenyl-diphosphatase